MERKRKMSASAQRAQDDSDMLWTLFLVLGRAKTFFEANGSAEAWCTLFHGAGQKEAIERVLGRVRNTVAGYPWRGDAGTKLLDLLRLCEQARENPFLYLYGRPVAVPVADNRGEV